MENTNNLTDLEKLGQHFLSSNPVEALDFVRKAILAEVAYDKANMINKNEEVFLHGKDEYSFASGDLYKNIDILYISGSDQDQHNFWRIYVNGKDISWDQSSGTSLRISDSTSVSIFKITVNGKGVLFASPMSTFVNWRSVDTAMQHLAKEFDLQYVDQALYKLADKVGIIV